ncbi:MAG: tyrosine-type recombinase/integrase [Minisyncoccia bacterium]
MSKPIKIPQNIKGLKLWCPACSEEIGTTNRCKQTGGLATKCPNAERHVYRVVVYEPGSGKRRVKIIKEKKMDLVIKAAVLFRDEIKNGKYIEQAEIPHNYEEEKGSLKLIEAMTLYSAFLDCKHGAAHTLRSRTMGHKKELMRSIILFAKAIKKQGIDPERLRIEKITQEHIGFYHTYLLSDKKYSNCTYNNRMNNLRGFINYLNKHEGLDINNPFNTVQKKPTSTIIKTIEPEEFNALLNIITPGRGIQTLSTGEKKNHWHPFLKESYILGLLTGLRREQLVTMRFKDIQEDAQGVPLIIASNNLKVNRIMNAEETGDIRITPTPVTPQLRQFLEDELNYAANRDSDNFLIAPNSELKRKTIMDIISKSFTHYWKQLDMDVSKDISFANLRKTYITKMTLAVGDNARHLTGHANQEVLNKHYINKELIARVASNHNIFPELDMEAIKRKNEIEKLRLQQQQNISKDR